MFFDVETENSPLVCSGLLYTGQSGIWIYVHRVGGPLFYNFIT